MGFRRRLLRWRKARMVGVNREAALGSQAIAVAPIEAATGPIEIGAVLVRD